MPTRAPMPATGVTRIARTDTASLGSTGAIPPPSYSSGATGAAPQRVARTGTGNTVPSAAPMRAARVAGSVPLATPGTSTAPGLPPITGRTASRVPAGTAGDASSAMAPARTSSRSVSTAGHEANLPPTRAVLRARRVSKIIVEKEKKTDYWQDIVQVAKAESDLSQEDINNLISRAMALDIVGNWKQRENSGTCTFSLLSFSSLSMDLTDLSSAPTAPELFKALEQTMEQRITEMNNGRPISVAGTGIHKIRNMEPILAKLEADNEKAAEQEEEKVKAKVGELQTSLRQLQQKKEAEIANKRKTMSLELNNLRGMQRFFRWDSNVL